MSISIEDILRSHGIGGGGGGGVKVITSTTQPIAGLTDGLVWYEPTLRKTKMYLGGEFQEVGGGGIVLTSLHARFKTTGVTNEVAIPVMNASVPSLNYNPSTDILIVSQNGTNITETIEYTLDKAAKKIVKTSGTWDDKTTFDFTAIVPTSTTQTDGVETVQIEDHVSVASGVTKVSFNITGFNTDVDLLEVHQRNMKIFKTRDWVLDPSGTFITLTEPTAEPEEFHFTVTKKIRTVTSGKLIAGSDIVDNSITKEKLSPEVLSLIDDFLSHVKYAVDTGTANAKVVTFNVAPPAYVDGMGIAFKNLTQNTGAVKINVNGLGLVDVLKSNGTPLSSGNLKANSIYTVRYNGTSFILQGEGGEYGTATANDVLVGANFGSETGLVAGAIPNHGSGGTVTPGTTNQTKPAGYYASPITVNGDPDLVAANIKSGVNLFGVDGTSKSVVIAPGLDMSLGQSFASAWPSKADTLEKVKEIKVHFSGTVRVRFNLTIPPSGSPTIYGRVYINDLPVGIQRSKSYASPGDTAYEEDFVVNENDLVQIYSSRELNGGYVSQFSINVVSAGFCTVII